MSVLGAMFSGISGLNANSIAMEVIGNNISNINTTAYKSSRADFSDILSKTLASGYSVGRGSQIQSITQIFTQGGFETTDTVTDLALEGSGFFILNDSLNNNNKLYTRAGNFHLDSAGYLVNAQGYRVQGFDVDAIGDNIGTTKDIQISNTPFPPKPTGDGVDEGTGVVIHTNLSSESTLNPGGAAFDVTNSTNTSNFVSSITVYDSLGNGHQISVYFRKSAEAATGNTWEWYAVASAADHASGVDTICAQGTLDFNTEGALTAESTTSSSFDFSGGATAGQAIGFDFGDSIADGGTGFTGSTQFGEDSALNNQSQDGYSPSYLEGIEIDETGKVIGQYANGETVDFTQIAIARFTEQGSLSQVGSNLFSETIESGSPIVGVATEAGNGRVYSNTLELSNVDMAQEFVNMITVQRGYQANSRSITSSDEMISELLQLKR
jgi:flagellar hook protein FlgE